MNRFSWIHCIRSCRDALDRALLAVTPGQPRVTPRPPCSLRPLSHLLAQPRPVRTRRPGRAP